MKTIIRPWSEDIIKKAIDFEIKRGGQVYYLHNRVETIGAVKKLLQELDMTSDKYVLLVMIFRICVCLPELVLL